MHEQRAREFRWNSKLAAGVAGLLLFLTLSGFSIWLLPFSVGNQILVILHTVLGIACIGPAAVYLWRHWRDYRTALLTHVKVTGYAGIVILVILGASGIVLTWQALFGTRISYAWDLVHTIATFGVPAFLLPHVLAPLGQLWKLKVSNRLQQNLRRYVWTTGGVALGAFLLALPPILLYRPVPLERDFPPDYSYRYGEDRPFAPSLATTTHGKALDGRILAGSLTCGTAGCHTEIVREWESSAHRYSAMDVAFQKIQLTMAEQNGPDSTRYCGGCHDPISLFSATKNIFTNPEQLTSLDGYQEGISCLACHAVRETDLKGNAHYRLEPPRRYLFEIEYQETERELYRVLRDFLIRAYPRHHVQSLSKQLFKTPEYCAACHKQFIDSEINNVGWVQLQNQFDNWRMSRWNHPGDPNRTIECRECHMPLVDSTDPASGDPSDYNRSPSDGKHRSHRFVAANQMMPRLLKLPGWETQVELTEKWLRGEYPIPEIAEKWAAGPAVSVELMLPEAVTPGEEATIKTVITSNKVGHDFPTGPLDIIQAWLEITVTDDAGNVIYASGRVDDKGYIEPGSFIFKAEPVDQYGNLIDRHNLWEMVGVRYRRALFPGFSDIAEFRFYCPDTYPGRTALIHPEVERGFRVPEGTTGRLHVSAKLKYRKIDQALLDFILGPDSGVKSPVTVMHEATGEIPVAPAAGKQVRGSGTPGSTREADSHAG